MQQKLGNVVGYGLHITIVYQWLTRMLLQEVLRNAWLCAMLMINVSFGITVIPTEKMGTIIADFDLTMAGDQYSARLVVTLHMDLNPVISVIPAIV